MAHVFKVTEVDGYLQLDTDLDHPSSNTEPQRFSSNYVVALLSFALKDLQVAHSYDAYFLGDRLCGDSQRILVRGLPANALLAGLAAADTELSFWYANWDRQSSFWSRTFDNKVALTDDAFVNSAKTRIKAVIMKTDGTFRWPR